MEIPIDSQDKRKKVMMTSEIASVVYPRDRAAAMASMSRSGVGPECCVEDELLSEGRRKVGKLADLFQRLGQVIL